MCPLRFTDPLVVLFSDQMLRIRRLGRKSNQVRSRPGVRLLEVNREEGGQAKKEVDKFKS